ncbi:MAG: GIY-YIG nuclease family protein [Rickettsiales bacterium]|jgi:hypothetical protein|nr:GIY-YIG nuclease family protein [Rickettsiales bacterium]
MSSNSRSPSSAIDTVEMPFDTNALRKGLKAFLDQPVSDPRAPSVKRLGGYKFGVYAFYDYDDEPIYVGQTREKLSGRIGRHLTNQRTDAVAMNVLDPYEVYAVAVWPLPEFEARSGSDAEVKAHLNALEAAVFNQLMKESKFSAVLNEKIPLFGKAVKPPKPYKGVIISDEVREIRGHPDVRLARRAATIARLSQVICERGDVQPGLRRTLLVQAERLMWLAKERYKPFEAQAIAEDATKEGEE